MVCYPTVGGSGIVATELGKHLARRGHRVHFISSEVPFRLRDFHENITFHQVHTPTYYLFKDSQYILSLANKIVEVHRQAGLDIIHAHYAVPHATAAYLAREMIGPHGPRVVTTLHGTDITLMGAEPSFADTIAFSINRSDAVTAVSQALRRQTYDTLAVTADIVHIPNFLDCSDWRYRPDPALRARFAAPHEKLVIHMSNFRPVKRVDNVVKIFAGIAREVPARLLLVGDGPDCAKVCATINELGIRDKVCSLGNQEAVVPLLSISDLFLLPSEQESFGLAALEAMACRTPVVASRVGGVPEVVVEGRCGFLREPWDLAGMTEAALAVLTNDALQRRMAAHAEERVRSEFCATRVVPMYEDLYHRVAPEALRPAT